MWSRLQTWWRARGAGGGQGGRGEGGRHLVKVLRLLEHDNARLPSVQRVVVPEPDTRARMKLHSAANVVSQRVKTASRRAV